MRFSIFGTPVNRLRRVIGPSEVLVLDEPTLLANLTDVGNDNAAVVVFNNGAAAIFYCLHTSASSAPSLTTDNGLPLASNSGFVFDKCGGIAIWAIAAADQTAGNGTRVSGAKV
jgi:hypothetical protein